jgi:hypothetical protein
MLDNGSMGMLLKRLGMIQYADNTYQRYRKPDKPTDSASSKPSLYNPFQRKRKIGEYLYTTSKRENAVYSDSGATRYISNTFNLPLVSLTVTPHSLHSHDKGILFHPEGTGRSWERPANLTVHHGGKQIFTGNTGIRLYGSNFERKILFDDSRQGYALYFRAEYGDSRIPGKVLFPESKDVVLRTVVLEQFDVIKKALAMELARKLELNQPLQQVVVLGLNSENPDLRFAREAVSHRQWNGRVVQQEFDLYISGDNLNDPGRDIYTSLIPWIPFSPSKRIAEYMNMETVGKYFDIDSLTRGIAFSIYCGSSDWHDWAVYRNQQPGSKIYWLLWEFGNCFSDRWHSSGDVLYKQDWLGVAITRSSETDQWRPVHNNARLGVFAGLMNYDPQYPAYFKSIMNEIISNHFEYSNLSEIIAHYRSLSEEFPDSLVSEDHVHIDQIDEFLRRRPEYILEQLRTIEF